MATPLQTFVNKNYAAPLRAGVLRKLKAKGFVPPAATQPLTTGGGGGAAAPRAGGTARDRLLPRTLIGVEGVRGPFFGITPNLNPQDWVTHTNDRGRTFLEPITEMTGLSSDHRQRVKTFDAATARQRPVVQTAYSDLQTSLNQNADATKARLASLGSLVQASPTVAGGTPGVPEADAQLADARRREATAASAVTVGQQSALPAIAATEGAKAVTAFDADRAAGREGLFSEIRTEQSQRAAAQLEALQAQKEVAAQLRGQDLQLLGTQISQQGGLERALVQSGSRERISQGELETRLLIAELNGNVSEANNIRTTLARLEAATISAGGKGGKGPASQRGKDTASFVKGIRKQLTGTFVKNPAYDAVTAPDQPQYIAKPGSQASVEGLLADAATQGVKIIPVLNAIRATFPKGTRGGTPAPWGRGDLGVATTIYQTLVDNGMAEAAARKIAKGFTGRDVRTGAEVGRPAGQFQ